MATGRTRSLLVVLVIALGLLWALQTIVGSLSRERIYSLDEYVRKFGASPTGTLRIDARVTSLTLHGSKATLMVPVKAGAADVPEGEWTVGSWTMEAKDVGGVAWTLLVCVSSREATRAFAATRSASTVDALYESLPKDAVTIAAGGETSYATGQVRGVLTVEAAADKFYSFTQELEDEHGRLASLMRSGGSQQPLPRLRIRNADGSYDATFDFQYG
jgi:hypothetical protein